MSSTPLIGSSEVKQIHISLSELTPSRSKEKTTAKPPPAPKKRVITTHKKWDFDADNYSRDYQFFLLSELHPDSKSLTTTTPKSEQHATILKQQIHTKWYGYRAQDIEKLIFSPEEFVSETDIVELLIYSQLSCFYCRENVQLLYENVRDPKQWSIERIDNKHGHNKENVVIACLGCNVRRKTMYHERFRATKQLCITKCSDREL